MLITLAALAGHISVVIVVLHIRSDLAPILLHLASAVIWHNLLLFLLFAVGAGAYYWHSAAIFAFGVMAFVFIFSAAYKSISLRAIVLLAESENGSVSVFEITEKLVMKSFVDRVDMLAGAGLVEQGPAGYSLTARGRRTADRIRALQKFFGTHTTGLYFTTPEKAGAQGPSAAGNHPPI